MDRPRFLADEMLGSLARWLRILGYDTEYVHQLTDREVLERARAESRILLTRDHQLAERAGEGGRYIFSDRLDEQLSQIWTSMRLDNREALTRCPVCNGQLVEVGPTDVGDEVPPRVRDSHDRFHRCSRCGKVYWEGSHWKDIRRRLDGLKELTSDSSPR
jgi:uncharacterized protein